MTEKLEPLTPHREYKSRMFTLIFNDREKLLKLYNAVSGKHYEDSSLLTINTLENAIYLSMKNDVSFIIDHRLSLYEHQSTCNPNMPLRFLMYLADVYSGMVRDANIYGKKLLPIPAPKFIVFYNGQEERPDCEVMHLSVVFITDDDDIYM